MTSRRLFLRNAALTAGTTALASRFTARSYAQIAGANDRLNFAVIGLNSRAYAHLSSLEANKATARIAQVCDVDTVILEKYAGATEKVTGTRPQTQQDFRKVLGSKDIDVVTIAMDFNTGALPSAVLKDLAVGVAEQAPDRSVAEHHRVAAVVRPRTFMPSFMIAPAPRKPMPETT